MPETETIFKPRYTWRNLGMLYIAWPLGIIGFIVGFIDVMMSISRLSNDWFPIIIWGFVALFPPFIYFRAIHFFDEQMIIKRYFLADWVIKYEDITQFNQVGLIGVGGGVGLSTLTPESFEELNRIIKPYITHTVQGN